MTSFASIIVHPHPKMHNSIFQFYQTQQLSLFETARDHWLIANLLLFFYDTSLENWDLVLLCLSKARTVSDPKQKLKKILLNE